MVRTPSKSLFWLLIHVWILLMLVAVTMMFSTGMVVTETSQVGVLPRFLTIGLPIAFGAAALAQAVRVCRRWDAMDAG
jgi:hypothetical protein